MLALTTLLVHGHTRTEGPTLNGAKGKRPPSSFPSPTIRANPPVLSPLSHYTVQNFRPPPRSRQWLTHTEFTIFGHITILRRRKVRSHLRHSHLLPSKDSDIHRHLPRSPLVQILPLHLLHRRGASLPRRAGSRRQCQRRLVSFWKTRWSCRL